jgi:uncharacterized protein
VPVDAAPGAMDTMMVTATSQGDLTESATSTLTTEAEAAPPPMFGVTLTPATAEQSGQPGQVVQYILTLTNVGITVDSYDITASGGTWVSHIPVTLIEDLEPGESATVQVNVLVPADAVPGDSDTMMVTAISQGDPTVSATSTLTTEAEAASPTYGVSLTPAADAKTGRPGTTVIYTLQLQNTGSVVDTINLSATGGWAHLPVTEFMLQPNQTVTVAVHVNIPANAADGATNAATVTAVSGGDPTESASSTLTTTVQWYRIFMPLIMKP